MNGDDSTTQGQRHHMLVDGVDGMSESIDVMAVNILTLWCQRLYQSHCRSQLAIWHTPSSAIDAEPFNYPPPPNVVNTHVSVKSSVGHHDGHGFTREEMTFSKFCDVILMTSISMLSHTNRIPTLLPLIHQMWSYVSPHSDSYVKCQIMA
jgi:hypothetical protein